MVFANHRDHLTNTACAHASNPTNNTEYPAWSQVVGMQCVEGYKGSIPPVLCERSWLRPCGPLCNLSLQLL